MQFRQDKPTFPQFQPSVPYISFCPPSVSQVRCQLLSKRNVSTLAFVLIACAPALAADRNGRQSAGYRVLALDNGRKVAVWYPAASAEPVASSMAA